MNDVTILYYTANVEDELFERKIRENILKNKGDLPIISVSQKPIDFGDNICVGEHEPCYLNLFRQIQIGLEKVRTTFIITTEADFLYPPDYFTFVPPETGHFYRYDNVWVLQTFKRRNFFQFKGFSDGAQMVDVKTFQDYLARTFAKQPEDTKENLFPYSEEYKIKKEYFWTGNPLITFKTGNSLRNSTSIDRKKRPKLAIPYWGRVEDVINNFCT